jgi:tetratricopeptide (TPR) repeat protein/transcriptional regulator with XRE-family HTH domain
VFSTHILDRVTTLAIEQSLGFSSLLKRHRRDARLTQEKLSERAGVSVHAISDLERGVYLAPHESTVLLLAKALGLSRTEQDRFLESARSGNRAGSYGAIAPDDGSLRDPGKPIVGRREEQSAIAHHLGSAGPPLLLLAGEPGIGKTRLLRETVRMATERKMGILWGGCERRSGQDPYTPLTQAVQQFLSRQSRSDVRAAVRGASWLVRLLPELHDTVQAPFLMGTLASEQERRLVFDSVTRFLANSAGPTGLLLAMDDLQWAGHDALDLLITLLRSAHSIPLRAIAAYRETDLSPGHRLTEAIADLAREGLASVLPIAELNAEDAAHLLEDLIEEGSDFDDATKHDIVRRSDGIPFFLVSYAEGLRSGAHTGGESERMPWSLSQSIRQRLASLPAETQDLLAALAIMGRGTSVALLAAVVNQTQDRVLQGLGPACRAGILDESADRSYHFSHDAIRDVAEADLDAPRRMYLHRRVAETLETLPQHRPERMPAALASHFRLGDMVERALPYTIQAGDRAESRSAHAEAELAYRLALELAETVEASKLEADASAKLGLVLAEAGQRSEARQLFDAATEKYRALGDVEGESRTGAWMTGVLETPLQGITRVTSLLGHMREHGPSEGRARLQEVLAYLLGLAGRDEEALLAAEKASSLARGLDDRLVWRSENLRGRALIELGRLDEGLACLEQTIKATRAAGDINEVSGLDHAASGYVSQGNFGLARARLERALRLMEEYGSPLGLAQALGELSLFYSLICDWDEVRSCLKRLEEITAAVDLQWERPVALGLLARAELSLAAGDWSEATRFLDESANLFERSGETKMRAPVMLARSEMGLLRGEATGVRDLLQPYVEENSFSPRFHARALIVLAQAQIELGANHAAARAAQTAADSARESGSHLHLIDALHTLGLAQSQLGEAGEGAANMQQAVSLARKLRYARGEASSLLAQGLVETEQGDVRTGADHMGQSIALFTKLHLEPYASLARQRAGRLRHESANAEKG